MAYRDADLPIETRVADLLQRMTLEGKVEQLRGGRTSTYGIVDPTGKFSEQSIQGNCHKTH